MSDFLRPRESQHARPPYHHQLVEFTQTLAYRVGDANLLATRWGPIPLHCMQSNCVVPIKHISSLDLLEWTLESLQQDCHKTRRTLMSPQERKIDWCTPNQLKVKHISPLLNPLPSLIPHHIQQVSWHPFQQSRHSLRQPSQVYRNISFSKAKGWITRAPHIVWRWELIPCLRMKR